jgi:hypothetical protein
MGRALKHELHNDDDDDDATGAKGVCNIAPNAYNGLHQQNARGGKKVTLSIEASLRKQLQ